MAGLLTRVAGFMLMCSMAVAIISAKRADIDGLAALGNTEEFAFAVIFMWLAVVCVERKITNRVVTASTVLLVLFTIAFAAGRLPLA